MSSKNKAAAKKTSTKKAPTKKSTTKTTKASAPKKSTTKIKDPEEQSSAKEKDKSGLHVSVEARRTSQGFWVDVDHIIANAHDNISRAVLFKDLDGNDACYEQQDLDPLIADMEAHGQINPVHCWVDGRGFPHLVLGFRRWQAIKHAKRLKRVIRTPDNDRPYAICFVKVDAPKENAVFERLELNLSENREVRPPSDLDKACMLQTLIKPVSKGGCGYSKEVAGQKVGLTSVSRVNQYLQLHEMSLALREEVFPKLHRGEIRLDAALKLMRKKGDGRTRGTARGWRLSTTRKRLESEPPPEVELTHEEWLIIMRWHVGLVVELESESENLRAMRLYLNPESEPPSTPAKDERQQEIPYDN